MRLREFRSVNSDGLASFPARRAIARENSRIDASSAILAIGPVETFGIFF
jgi:hypothetical protein